MKQVARCQLPVLHEETCKYLHGSPDLALVCLHSWGTRGGGPMGMGTWSEFQEVGPGVSSGQVALEVRMGAQLPLPLPALLSLEN